MIKICNVEIIGWEAAIRGMRNPLESWDRSDTLYIPFSMCDEEEDIRLAEMCLDKAPIIKDNDLTLMKNLAQAGSDHAKYRRFINVTLDINAPLYWWKEFDTYKVGTVANSCSTMHKIHSRDLTMEDFSCEHLDFLGKRVLESTITAINEYRAEYIESKDKSYWYQMIQLLPSSYNQLRTIQLNYEVLVNIYHSRKNHPLDEWHEFCEWIERLPYSEIITGE